MRVIKTKKHIGMYQDVVAGSFQEKVKTIVSAAREVSQPKFIAHFFCKALLKG